MVRNTTVFIVNFNKTSSQSHYLILFISLRSQEVEVTIVTTLRLTMRRQEEVVDPAAVRAMCTPHQPTLSGNCSHSRRKLQVSRFLVWMTE